MIRFFYVIIINIFTALHFVNKMKYMINHQEKYSEEECYEVVRHIVWIMKFTGAIRTKVYGTENLPKEGGYVMYPNHQGKYDAYGIVYAHDKPCTVVMDIEKSYTILIREIIDLLKGKRLDKKDARQAMTIIKEVGKEVESGRRYVIFPEGGYGFNNRNRLQEFKAGCFKSSMKSKTPIVPVALIDSYKVFDGIRQFGIVTTQVHFLEPIYYEEYAGMKTPEIADLVKSRIQKRINEVEGR